MEPSLLAESRAVLHRHARSFRIASWFLPEDRAADAAVVYAFCRLVDDTADEATDSAAAAVALAELRGELAGERPARPLVELLKERCTALNLSLTPFHALIEGAVSDLDSVRMQDDRELLRYAWRVAGTVGWMMCGVLGVSDDRALPHAVDLGVAMQLTNIARDVAEDAKMGRIYLPLSRLQSLGVTSQDLLTGQANPAAVAQVVRDLLTEAERWYRSGRDGMAYIPWRSRLAIYVASSLYRGIGRRLFRNGGDALSGRTVLPLWERMYCVVLGISSFFVDTLRSARPHNLHLHQPLAGLPGVRS
jgi:15-cis-phytoene synthase